MKEKNRDILKALNKSKTEAHPDLEGTWLLSREFTAAVTGADLFTALVFLIQKRSDDSASCCTNLSERSSASSLKPLRENPRRSASSRRSYEAIRTCIYFTELTREHGLTF